MNFEDTILTLEAKDFLLNLNRHFAPELNELLQARILRQRGLREGGTLDFLKATSVVRDSQWQVAPAPLSLTDRRVEITGPAEPKMMINALNSGASVFMADLEDSLSPTWQNVTEAQMALYQYSRGELKYTNELGKTYELNEKTATLVVRPRGLHLREMHFLIDNVAIPAALFDFGLHFWHNAKALLAANKGPYFYLPKMESHLEARWWNSVFVFAQDYLRTPQRSVRATVLIETIPAAFEMEEILFELKDHASGLNAGRWDYIFSMIKKFSHDPGFILPDRSLVTMATSFMSAYATLLVQTCHRRGAHAIGGMSAFIPNRKAAEVTERALAKVTEDKAREAALGFDGSWVAHPDLVAIAKAQFDKVLGSNAHQKNVLPKNEIKAKDLLDLKFESFVISEAGVRANINVAILYIERWLAGVGAVSLHNLMEDAATAEISRSQIWQWLKHKVQLNDGREFTPALYAQFLREEIQKIGTELVFIDDAVLLFSSLVNQTEFKEFLTSVSEHKLNQIHYQKPILWTTNKGGAFHECNQ